MSYCGFARNDEERFGAISLAAQVFKPDLEDRAAMEYKISLHSPSGTLKNTDIVVVSDNNAGVSAACFLVDRHFFMGESVVQGTFLTSICVAEKHRGAGISRELMNGAVRAAKERHSAFAAVIARRAVDHYYNKFYFWGMSQYASFKVPVDGNWGSGMNSGDFDIPDTQEIHLDDIAEVHYNVYRQLHGAFQRPSDYWRYVLWRCKVQNVTCSTCLNSGRIMGYAIHQGSTLYEIALSHAAHYPVFIRKLFMQSDSPVREKTLNLQVHPNHPVIPAFRGTDITLQLRECSYGGHMFRVLDGVKLSAMSGNRAANVSTGAQSLDFETSCRLMNARQLTLEGSAANNDLNALSIPLMDQC